MALTERVRVLCVSNQTSFADVVRVMENSQAHIEVVAVLDDPSEAFHKIDLFTPHLLLLDIRGREDQAIRFVERATKAHPFIPLVVLSDQTPAQSVRLYMRAGARDFLQIDDEQEPLPVALAAIYKRERERTGRQTMAMLGSHSVPTSSVIAFVSAKGGVGKSTLAINTAAAFALQGRRTALVDLDLQFGDASLLSNCTPEKNIIHLVQESSDIDTDVIERYMMTHSTGVRLLCTGAKPEEAEYVTAADVRLILQALRKNYEFVIVDTAPLANDVFFAVLDVVDEQLMISTLNLAVIKNNRLLLDLLAELDYDVSQVKHVLNRANARNGLKIQDVAQVLKTNIYAEIDNDYQFVETAANEGTLFVQKDSQHRLTRQLYALTAKLEQAQGRVVSRRNPLRSWITKFST